MSTDIYGVRVVSVSPQELQVRFQVFVVYYDTEVRTYSPVSDDLGFFFHLLWEGASGYCGTHRDGPLSKLVNVHTLGNHAWVDANARRFISGVEHVATRNHPPTDEQWGRLSDFYYERGGAWKDEDLLVQSTYDVRVTDRRWLEPLRVGDAWGTTAFPLNADTWTAGDAPHIPDLERPAVTLRPFTTATGDLKYDHLAQVAFSDDGSYLATASDQGRVWVYDTTDWTEVVHTSAGDVWDAPVTMWVPGEHVLTVKSSGEPGDSGIRPQWAFDVDARREVEIPFQEGHLRSRDGAYRIGPNETGDGSYDLLPTERSPHRHMSHAGHWDPVQCADFAGDGSRLFLAAEENIYVVDPATGEVVDRVADASDRLYSLASNPDGGYVAVGSASRKLGYLSLGKTPPHEICVWRMADKKIVLGRHLKTYVNGLAWSPDGRWLAAALEPTAMGSFNRGRTELVIFPMGPADE
ncbi:WD40 repeat domain-containing protein [Streptomyces sp. I05A-00742]|uniref:WD40 repeat domain-containing protein n=1 Tax=Streptomyces sp. I05A-00742 TaxID=2732853 RepID=UPI001487E6FA|nr:hypothetical protein [Streptomyces sp. I05A-00742]